MASTSAIDCGSHTGAAKFCVPKEGEVAKVCQVGRVVFTNEDKEFKFNDTSSNRVQVFCACKFDLPMVLTELKEDYRRPSYCHCGEINGEYFVAKGKLLYICANTSNNSDKVGCPFTHECHQNQMFILEDEWPVIDAVTSLSTTVKKSKLSKQVKPTKYSVSRGDPLGIPCCTKTRIYRLHLHHLMEQLWRFNRNKTYYHLSHLMQLSSRDCHVAMFSQSECLRALTLLEAWKQLSIDSKLKHLIFSFLTAARSSKITSSVNLALTSSNTSSTASLLS